MGWRDRLQTLRAEELAQTAQVAVGPIPRNQPDEAGWMEREAVASMMRAALQRPPSWANAASPPSAGCWCSCCHGRRWWTEAINPRGWRCSTCCPGDCLPAAQRDEVKT